MHFGDEEKPGRKAALQKLMTMMSGAKSKKLEGIKKPALAVEVDAPVDDDKLGSEPDADDSMEGEPSEDDKMKIAELYHKFCK